MDPSESGDDARAILERALCDLLPGEDLDLEELVDRHPEQGEQLRRLHSEFGRGQAALGATLPTTRDRVVFFGRPSEAPRPPVGVSPGQVLGEFRLIDPIAQGGMGQVWTAEQVPLRRRVALKIVRPDRVTARRLDLFSREARAGGRLHHPGIVAVHGHGESGGLAWIAMELVEGCWTLRDFLDEVIRRGELAAGYYRDVAVFAAKLADALQAAHAAGVIHRDLKPQNVLITPADEPKVTDFGLARITDEPALSATGDLAGTYYYMSPEQVAARRPGIDHRTDIFSLGVVLYEMLALRRPFEGDTTHQIADQIMFKDPPDLHGLRSRIPRDLAVICGKCLEKDRDRRYATMADLALDLRKHLSRQPILARPPGRLRRLELWVRRNPTRSGAGALAISAFGVISLLLAENVRANRELTGEIASVKRLSALQDYEELITRANELWPPHPGNIPAYRRWIADARALVAELPLHYAKRDELRLLALPQSEEERGAERTSHPDFGRLEALSGEIGALRAELRQRRDGIGVPPPELEWESLPTDAAMLDALAWSLVDPGRRSFGREAEGLALSRRALELAEASQDDAVLTKTYVTMSAALHALGLDAEAAEALETARAVAPARAAKEYEGLLWELELSIEQASSELGLDAAQAALTRMEAERAELEERVSSRRTWRFPESADGRDARWWHGNLSKLVEALEGLHHEPSGLLSEGESALSPVHGWSVPRRLRFAEQLGDGQAEGGQWHGRWMRAIAAIRSDPIYDGLELESQAGLVPIGADPDSGLWEFWHVATGEEPRRGSDGRLVLDAGTALVLVLIPGGTFWMGAQSGHPSGRNHDPQARINEGPVHEVTLSPYFLSKYEMTQLQWSRVSGVNPSYWKSRLNLTLSPTSPVEMVSWDDCMREFARMGLTLPSEAQWEYACRARTETPWWTGRERESLREKHAANLADRSAARAGLPWPGIDDWPELDDGYVTPAPIGTYAPNAFGLHEVHGNVDEWCLDGYDTGAYGPSPETDPVEGGDRDTTRAYRGGCFHLSADYARSAIRRGWAPSNSGNSLGVRPARAVLD